MDLKNFDDKCVRITTTDGEAYEGTVSYCGKEYVLHEYGVDEEALALYPILFYRDDIAGIISLEDVTGPFGHYSGAYGLLEIKCLEWGTDMIEEVLDGEDDIRIRRMLACMSDHFQSLANRALPGRAPRRAGGPAPEDEEEEQGPVYLEELKNMLESLARHSANGAVAEETRRLLARFDAYFS